MAHESGSPAWSIEAGDRRKWFDWWRIATAALAVLFLAGSVLFFVEAAQERRAYDKCEAEERAKSEVFEGYRCEDWDLSGMFEVIGIYLLAVAGCFGVATVADQGSGLRRASTGIGGLLFPPALIGFAAIALMTALLGRLVGLVRRVVRQSPPAVSGEIPRGSR